MGHGHPLAVQELVLMPLPPSVAGDEAALQFHGADRFPEVNLHLPTKEKRKKKKRNEAKANEQGPGQAGRQADKDKTDRCVDLASMK